MRSSKSILNHFLLLWILSSISPILLAQSVNVYTGSGSQPWNNASSWSLNRVPNENDIVRIFQKEETLSLPQNIKVHALEVTNCSLFISVKTSIVCTEQLVLRNTAVMGVDLSIEAKRIDIGPSSGRQFFEPKLSLSTENLGLKKTDFSSDVALVLNGTGGSFLAGGNHYQASFSLTVNSTGGVTLGGAEADSYQSCEIAIKAVGAEVKMAFAKGTHHFYKGFKLTENKGKLSFGQNGGLSIFHEKIMLEENTEGDLSFEFTESRSPEPTTLSLANDQQILFLGGNVWNGDLHVKAGNIRVDSSLFDGRVKIEKTGLENSASLGGNTFNKAVQISTADTGFYLSAQQYPDIFNDSLNICAKTGRVLLAQAASGNVFRGPITLKSEKGASVSIGQNGGTSRFEGNASLSVPQFEKGIVALLNIESLSENPWKLDLGENVLLDLRNNVFSHPLNIEARELRSQENRFMAPFYYNKLGNKSDFLAGNNVFSDSVRIAINDSGSVFMGQLFPDTVNGPLTVDLFAEGSIYLANRAKGNVFSQDLQINNHQNGSVFLGQGGGSSNLSAITTPIWNDGLLSIGFASFDITDSLIINLGQKGKLHINKGNIIEQPCRLQAASILIDSTVFEKNLRIIKTGSSFDASKGGNRFIQELEVYNLDSGSLSFGGKVADVFMGKAIFYNHANGNIFLWHGADSTLFHQHPLLMAYSGEIRGGQAGGSVVFLDNSEPLFPNDTSLYGRINLRRFSTSTGADTLKIFTPKNLSLFIDSSTFRQAVIFEGNQNYVQNSRFIKELQVIKPTGSGNFWQGGNRFEAPVYLRNFSGNPLAMGSLLPDTFFTDVYLESVGSSLSIAHATDSNVVKGQVYIKAQDATIRLGQSGGLNYYEAAPVLNKADIKNSLVYIKDAQFSASIPAITWSLDSTSVLILQNNNVFRDSLSVRAGSFWLDNTQYTHPVNFVKTGESSNIGFGSNQFFSPAYFHNEGKGFINLSYDSLVGDVFHAPVYLSATRGGIRFGFRGANSIFPNGMQLLNFNEGFTQNAELVLSNINLQATDSIGIGFKDNSKFSIGPNFEAFKKMAILAPLPNLNASIFHKPVTIESFSEDYFVSTGENIFYDSVDIQHKGSSGFGFASARFFGPLDINLSDNFSLFVLNKLNTSSDITFNAPPSPTQAIIVDQLRLLGSTDQTIRINGFTDDWRLQTLRLNKSSGVASFFKRSFVRDSLQLFGGIGAFRATAPLVLGKQSFTEVSDSLLSYIDGFVETDGGVNQILPLGKDGIYAPILLRSFSTQTKARATFSSTSILQHFPGINRDSNIEYVNPCGFWTVENLSNPDIQVSVIESERNFCSPFFTRGIESRYLFATDSLMLTLDIDGNNAGSKRINGVVKPKPIHYISTGSFLDFRPLNQSPDSLLLYRHDKASNAVEFYKRLGPAIKQVQLLRSYNDEAFVIIDTLDNSGQQKNAFTDVHLGNGLYRYAIAEVYQDGFKQYSDIESLNISDALDVDLFPNPSTGPFQLNFNFVHPLTLNIEIFSSQGVLIETFAFYKNRFQSKLNLDYSDFNPGLYIVRIRSKDGIAEFKWQKI